MEVYVELTCLNNFFIMMIVFEMMVILLNVEIHYKTIIKNSLLCNITFLMIYLDNHNWYCLVVWLLVLSIIFKKQVFLYYPLFLVSYFSIVFFISSLINDAFIYNGVLITPINYVSITMMLIGVFFVIMQLIYITYLKRMNSNKKYIYDVKLYYLNKRYSIIGFLDSGNECYYHGLPLIFVKENILQDYHIIDNIFVDCPYPLQINIIKIDILDINSQKLTNVYAGVIKNIKYDCLLNKQMMGGIL